MFKGKQINPQIIMPLAVVSLGAVAYFGLLRPLTNKLGLTKSAEDKEIQRTGNSTYWSTSYWQSKTGSTIITNAAALAMCKIIYNSLGRFSDDDVAIMGVFRGLKTKSQVSYLAFKYFQTYKKDLYNHLRVGAGSAPWNGLNDTEMKRIIDYTNGLPAYKA